MTGPRHLWSGDWLRESAASRERLARGREQAGPADDTIDAPSAAGREFRSPAGLGRAARKALAALAALRQVALRRLRRLGDALNGTVASGLRWPRLLAIALIAAVVGGAVEVAVAGGGSNTPRASATSHAWLGVRSGAQPGQTGALVEFVVPGGPADQAGLWPGDVITAVNGRSIAGPADLASARGGMPPGQPGALVELVVPGGPADQAGLWPGDVITAVNGRSIAGPADLASAIGGMPTGQRVSLQVVRAGQQVVIEVTLGTRPTGVP